MSLFFANPFRAIVLLSLQTPGWSTPSTPGRHPRAPSSGHSRGEKHLPETPNDGDSVLSYALREISLLKDDVSAIKSHATPSSRDSPSPYHGATTTAYISLYLYLCVVFLFDELVNVSFAEHKSPDRSRPSAQRPPPRPRSYLNDNDKLQGAYDLIAKIKADRERKRNSQVRESEVLSS